MSEEDVQIVADLYELYGRGDMNALLAKVAPDVEVDLTDRLPDEEVMRGREAYRSFLEEGFKMFANREAALQATGPPAGRDQRR